MQFTNNLTKIASNPRIISVNKGWGWGSSYLLVVKSRGAGLPYF